MKNELDRAPTAEIKIENKKRALETLARTRQYLANGWCKFHWAVNAQNKPVPITAKTVTGRCLSAAFICACIDTKIGCESMEYHYLYEYLLQVIRRKTRVRYLVISQYNDNAKSAKQVLDILDAAIFGLAEGKIPATR